MTVRNLDYIHAQDPKLYETLSDIIQAHDNTSLQANLNGAGWPAPPPQIHRLQVTAENGHFQVAITDHNPLYRDVHYYVEHANNPNFTDAHVVHMGHSRNYSTFLGNTTRYFRAYSSYSSSPPGAPVYHGGSMPKAVSGGGDIPGPKFLASQSSGTGTPGQALTGPGIVPFRGQGAKVPSRGTLEPTALLPVQQSIPPGSPVTGSGGAVSSVFGRTGAVVAQAGDYLSFYPAITTQIIAGAGLTGGGPLSANVTLSAIPLGASGAAHAAGMAPDPGATAGITRFLREDAAWVVPPSSGGTGTVTSVGLTMPAEFTVAGSPITASGTLAVTKAAQSANQVYAGPASGSAVAPVFRALVSADIPLISLTSGVTGILPVVNGGSGTATPALVAGVNVTITGTWPNQTISSASAPVTSVFTRTGPVVAVAGDYTAAQVTNAVDATASYANPAWITSLAYSKLTGAPTVSGSANYVPLFVTASSLGNSVIYQDASARVGINSTTPRSRTNIAGMLTIDNNADGSPTTGAGIELEYGTSGFIRCYDRTNSLWKSLLCNSAALELQTNGNFVGIGPFAATPAYPLHLSSNAANYYISGAGPTVTYRSVGAMLGLDVYNNAELALGLSTISGNWITWLQARSASNAALPLALNPAGGNVGIGTTSPNVQLTVVTNSAASSGIAVAAVANGVASTQYAIQATANGAVASSTGVYISVSGATTNNYGLRIVNPPAGAGNWAIYADATAPSYFAGQVGIGAAPGCKLTVVDNAGIVLRLQGTAAGGSNNTQLRFYGTASGEIWGIGTDAWLNNGSTDLYFLPLSAAPVLTLQRAGNVGIGTTAPGYQLQLGTDSAAKPATTTWTVASDARLKRNVRDLAGGLSVIERLHLIEGEYNGLGGMPDGLRVVGLLAHELREILPGAVGSKPGKIGNEETDILDMNIHEVLMHLILAVQQINQRLEKH